jgi:LysR family transcriptional regulator, low CO2-responsive transcriptional regulator
MNLHQLRIFVTVAKRGSFSRAAEELHISQPSASIQVADLERALGVDLFEQAGRQIHLTEAGRVLEDYARRILALTDEARTAVSETAGLRRGHLAVGASPTPGTYLLPRLIAAFQERYPQISVALHIGMSTEVGERLMRHELDLGVVGGKIHTPGLQTDPFLDDEIVLVAAPAHPLAAAGSPRAIALRDHRLILPERGSDTRAAIDEALSDAGQSLAPAFEVAGNEAIKEAAAAGLGVALLSRLAVRTEVAAGRLVVIPIPDLVIRRPFSVVYLKDRRLSQAVRAFVEMLRASVSAARA